MGKSALALDLISRGHRLVADDAIELHRSAAGQLIGRCPATLHGFLEVRGLGVLDVRRHFGVRSLQRQSAVDLIIALNPRAAPGNRLTGNRRAQRLLGLSVPRIALRPGHNLAVLVEAACHAESLRRSGFNAATALAHRQLIALQSRR